MYHPPDYVDNIPTDRQLREVLRCLLIEWGEAELNALVVQAYGLDEDDITVIEGSIGRKKGVQLSSEENESGDGG